MSEWLVHVAVVLEVVEVRFRMSSLVRFPS